MTRLLLLGHRGARASRHIPENTLASFALCLQHGCDGFEFDVRRSADGEAVICHDATYKGREIAQTPAKSLGLPTLAEVLQHFSSRAFLDIELKVPGLEQQTIAVLRKHPPHRGYLVSSFLPDVSAAFHVLDGSIPLGFLCQSRAQLRQWPQSPAEWVVPHVKLADRELIDQAHSSGKKVMVWTVNRPQDVRRFADWGVDAIITDETEVVTQVLRVL
ncbi:MAG TPA: glycerophosphodiester phosphodiesterase [Terriglobales bacterium]|nr:glycerophosphodiester phosphodiesterase [Terriglobales bacterium]